MKRIPGEVRSRFLGVTLLSLLFCGSSVALAKEVPVASSPKRSLPDYEGRVTKVDHDERDWLWGPRILLSPFYLTSEYVLRRPMGELVTTAERDQWPTKLLDFFTFGPERKAGLIPSALVDFGFRPSIGLYFFWDDVGVKGNDLRAHVATWGIDWLKATALDRLTLSTDTLLLLRGEAERRSDNAFFGMGPRSREELKSRYSADRLELAGELQQKFGRNNSVSGTVGVRRMSFREGSCCEDPSLNERIAAGELAAPPGYGSTYSLAAERLHFTLDSRAPKGRAGSGVRLDAYGEHATLLPLGQQSSWIRYGGTLGGFWDVGGRSRVLGLRLAAEFIEPLASTHAIPFTEQVSLGGDGELRGFWRGRLIDRSALSATLLYQWPVWVWLDGVVQLGMGNVFGSQAEDFSAKLLRLSGTIGFRSAGSPDHAFELLVGCGTETIDDHLRVSSFRFVVGSTNGF